LFGRSQEPASRSLGRSLVGITFRKRRAAGRRFPAAGRSAVCVGSARGPSAATGMAITQRRCDMIRTLMVAVAVTLLAPAAWADDVKREKSIEKKEVDKENPLDRDFLVAVAQRNTNADACLAAFEKLASSDKVKQFAKDMKKDHDAMQKEIAAAMKNKKIVVVAALDKPTRDKIAELRNTKDTADRDKTFLTYFVDCHEKLLKMAEHQKDKARTTTRTNWPTR
jgi:predicted outer membrane protein